MLYASRNDALQFALRTQRNLLFIENARKTHDELHPITQLANSMLGLVVLPLEKHFVDHIEQLQMDELVSQGWPQFEITLGECGTLGYLVKRLRNATAHGHMTFSSDSHLPEQVVIEVEDYKPKSTKPFWRARFTAAQLRTFCLKFVQLIDETVG